MYTTATPRVNRFSPTNSTDVPVSHAAGRVMTGSRKAKRKKKGALETHRRSAPLTNHLVDRPNPNPSSSEASQTNPRPTRVGASPSSARKRKGSFQPPMTFNANNAAGNGESVALLFEDSNTEDEHANSQQDGSGTKRRRKRQILSTDDELFSVSAHALVYFCSVLPLGALMVCVLLSLALHFKEATRTHCGVVNYLPSISAAIAEQAPETTIWRVCIALHCLPRFAAAFAYKNYYAASPLRPVHSLDSDWFRFLCWLLCFTHFSENAFLVLLTYVASTENHELHKLSFGLFVLFSMCYMALTLHLFDASGRRRASSLGEQSFQHKLVTFSLAVGSLALSAYFYYRHNRYCEPGVYTLFAACEYVYVVGNVLFHASMHLDFNDKKLALVTHHHFALEPPAALLHPASSSSSRPKQASPVGEWKVT